MKLQIFYDKKVSKADSNHTCLVLISWDSALKKDVNYHPQVLLKEFNPKKTESFIETPQVVQKVWRISLSILATFIDFHQFFGFFDVSLLQWN